MKISVIIPTLNEAVHLASVLDALAVEPGLLYEVVVVDGGSNDDTLAVAKTGKARVVVCSPGGRARQMNRGAEESSGDILFFLHADTLVPNGALALIEEACGRDGLVGGGFIRQFDSDSSLLQWTCRLADWRSENWGLFLGDQGIFVKREIFESLGGFDENLSRCEDLRFSMSMRDAGEVVALRPAVVSSARRFEKLGPICTTLRDGWWTVRHLIKN